jgi:hypothetical protein
LFLFFLFTSPLLLIEKRRRVIKKLVLKFRSSVKIVFEL